MLNAPKGLRYWQDTPNGTQIANDAPQWAKDEFQEYQDMMTPKTDKDGTTITY